MPAARKKLIEVALLLDAINAAGARPAPPLSAGARLRRRQRELRTW